MLHWFPGHMHKATKEFRRKMPQIDIAIEVVDARLPDSSSNHVLENIVGDKPIIKILSKSDLACPNTTKLWLQHYKGSAIAIDTLHDKNVIMKIIDLAQKKLPNRGTVLKPIRAIIFGIPNVGKSTLINKLAGRKIAKTGNEPAVTKLQQRIDIKKGFIIYDTPGIMFPSPKNELSGLRIGAIGSIRDTAMEYQTVAEYMIELLKNTNNTIFKTKYNVLDNDEHPRDMLKRISGAKTNFNTTQAAKNIVHDFRSGKLGRISLENPQQIELEKQIIADISIDND